jgi:hypothetical protein
MWALTTGELLFSIFVYDLSVKAVTVVKKTTDNNDTNTSAKG